MSETSLTREEINFIIDALISYDQHLDKLLVDVDHLWDVDSFDEDAINHLLEHYANKRSYCNKLARKLSKAAK